MPQPSPQAVRDTLAAIFRQPEFDRSLRETLWSRVTGWVGQMLERLTSLTAQSPSLAWALRVLGLLAALLVVARLAYVLWARRPAVRRPTSVRAVGASSADPWRESQAAAAEGRYTEAAHLLYEALLRSLAARERLRLHPAKTLGDYARELRSRSSAAFGSFRDFARGYETVVYGEQHCDRERYERLSALAAPLLAPAPTSGRRADG